MNGLKKKVENQIKKPHPLEIIKVPELNVRAYEYFQICATGLLENGFMSKIQHKKFIKKLKLWLSKNKVEFKHEIKESKQ